MVNNLVYDVVDLKCLKFTSQEEETMAIEAAKQRDLEELAKKREEELQVKLKKFGVEPLTTSEISLLTDKYASGFDIHKIVIQHKTNA